MQNFANFRRIFPIFLTLTLTHPGGVLAPVVGRVPDPARLSFLDLGAAPGGFAAFLLERGASGVGVTLPVAEGGAPR